MLFIPFCRVSTRKGNHMTRNKGWRAFGVAVMWTNAVAAVSSTTGCPRNLSAHLGRDGEITPFGLIQVPRASPEWSGLSASVVAPVGLMTTDLTLVVMRVRRTERPCQVAKFTGVRTGGVAELNDSYWAHPGTVRLGCCCGTLKASHRRNEVT